MKTHSIRKSPTEGAARQWLVVVEDAKAPGRPAPIGHAATEAEAQAEADRLNALEAQKVAE